VNGINNHWMNKVDIDGIKMNIDKSTDFMFISGNVANFNLYDITNYPKTILKPFTHSRSYPLLSSKNKKKVKNVI